MLGHRLAGLAIALMATTGCTVFEFDDNGESSSEDYGNYDSFQEEQQQYSLDAASLTEAATLQDAKGNALKWSVNLAIDGAEAIKIAKGTYEDVAQKFTETTFSAVQTLNLKISLFGVDGAGAEQIFASNDYDLVSLDENDKTLWDSQCAATPDGNYNVLAQQGETKIADGKVLLVIRLCDFAGILTSTSIEIQSTQARVKKFVTFECTVGSTSSVSENEVLKSNYGDPVCKASYTPISLGGLSFPAAGLGNIGKVLEVPNTTDLVPFEVTASQIELSKLGVTRNFGEITNVMSFPSFLNANDGACPVVEVVRTTTTPDAEEVRLFLTKAKDTLGKDTWQGHDITSWPDVSQPEVIRYYVHCTWFLRAEDSAVRVGG